MNIILGLVIAAVGALITIKSEAMLEMFGRVEFFERHLGTEGGTRLGYKLLGIAVFFIGVMIATNVIGDFLMWILSPVINAGKGGN
jgi:hypothetical protein